MRYIQALSKEEKIMLLECQEKHKKSQVRNRSHALLLSDEGKATSFIAALFKVRTRTIYEWFNRWESNGIMGILLKPGRGRKAKLNDIDTLQQQFIEKEVRLNPQKLDKVAELLNSKLSFKVTKNMLKNYLKKS